MPCDRVHTYSIVALDPHAAQLGVAVQSHYFCSGRAVLWAEPGVGAVATQASTERSYGPLGLALMRSGCTAEQALAQLVGDDAKNALRQVAMVDACGTVAAHTGSMCIREAGHRVGKHYSVQANMMWKPTVWDAMASAYESADGDLAERLVIALEAAEEEGGDIRGRQSAGLLVVGGTRTDPPWSGRLFDLRVDDHPQPLEELRRLVEIKRAYRHAERADDLLSAEPLTPERFAMAEREFAQVLERLPLLGDNPELVFWHAVALARAGRVDEACQWFQRVFRDHARWRELLPRLVPCGSLPDDPELMARIVRPPDSRGV